MTNNFRSLAKRLRSWFNAKQPRSFRHRAGLLIEQLEDRRVPASGVNLLVLPNVPLPLTFSSSTFTSSNPAISGSLNNGTDYFLTQGGEFRHGDPQRQRDARE